MKPIMKTLCSAAGFVGVFLLGGAAAVLILKVRGSGRDCSVFLCDSPEDPETEKDVSPSDDSETEVNCNEM